MKKLLILLASVFLIVEVNAQSPCTGLKNPTNFMGWYGKTGIRNTGISTSTQIFNSASTSPTNLPWTSLATVVTQGSCGSGCNNGSAPDNNKTRFQIITAAGNDAHTGNTVPRIPTGFSSVIRLGDMCSASGESAEALFYEMNVNAQNALIFIDYAVVLESPSHGPTGNPEFIIRVCNKNANGQWQNAPINDSLYYIIQAPNSSVATLPAGWSRASIGGCDYVYKPWAKVAINLNSFLYEQVRIEIYISDCNAQFHGGYCYIAGDCQPMQLLASDCAAGDATEVATITAPKGLDSYRWQAKDINGNWYDLDNANGTRNPNDSILRIQTVDFPMGVDGNRLPSNDFKCIMTSSLDPTKPITSWLQTTVNNKKPYISIDTSSICDGTVILEDISVAPYAPNPSDMVDTSRSQWDFGDGSPIKIGGRVSHKYATAGDYQITLRTTAANGECYAVGGRPVKVRKAPLIELVTSDTNICENDKLSIRVLTNGVLLYDYSWIIKDEDGNFIEVADEGEIYDPEGNYLYRYTFQDTTIVEFRARNAEGCDTTISININAEEFPELVIQGDTVICNGTQSIVNVTSNMPNCTYEWYLDTSLTTPNYTGSQMVRTPTEDEIYYVKVTTPNGCVSWDSLRIRLMIPELSSDKVKICAYDTVQLIGKNAVTYEWTANPEDPSLEGQEGNDTIYVTPLVSTTYKMVGLGSNGCRANPLYKNITVYPYPVPQLEYDPTFVDSEDPFITFNNLTLGATYTEWDFHDGKKMNGATVTYEFKDLTIDSAYVTMTTSNEMGCTSDTTIAMPISIFAVWVPNAFTPDKSTNNKFRTYTGNDIRDYSLYVYDREGRQVFYTDDKEGAWDGTFNGKKCKQGVYVWVASYRRLETDKVLQQKGTVTLIR